MSEKNRPHPWVTLICLVLVGIAILSQSACMKKTDAPPPSASAVLCAMQTAMDASVPKPPDGRHYNRALPADHPDYLTDTLLSALYGEAARGLLTVGEDGSAAAVGDVAFFLSMSPHPCEVAVFRCSDARGSTTAAKLCRARLEIIRHAWSGTTYEGMVTRAAVSVEGSYVLLVVAEDPESVIEAARRLIRG